ncbi:Ulp1 protease family, carboxy-terminal domain protein [Arachis hypogaea]|nr:Ulp1 protease family, carboxy-terminal domain protein [Arachis hypogaea]
MQPPPPLNNVELMATLKALTAAVEVLTSKVEACEGRQQERDRVVQLICSPAQRDRQTMLEYSTEIKSDHLEVVGASKKARTEKHAFGDQNTNVFICIPDDDDTETNRPNVARYCAPPWKGQKTTSQVKSAAKGKSDVAQGTLHAPSRVKRFDEQKSISRKSNHLPSQSMSSFLSGGIVDVAGGVPFNPPPPVIGRPPTNAGNAIGCAQSNLNRMGSMLQPFMQPSSPPTLIIQGVPTTRGLAMNGGLSGSASTTSVKLFGSLVNMGGGRCIGQTSCENLVRPSENKLNQLQSLVVAYVFKHDGDPEEELVRFRDCVLMRHHFGTLQLGQIPDDEFFHAFAMRMTLSNDALDGRHFWSLPPSFARDVREGKLVTELINNYKEIWMKPSMTLHYAYFPIKENSGHWYLAVIGFREGVIYLLDSCTGEEENINRRAFVRNLGDMVSRMVGNPSYPIEFSRITGDLMNFRISPVERVPACQQRDTSAVLVLNWMAMGDTFQHNLHHKMDEYMVRVHTALALLMAPFNEARHWMPKLK